MWGWRGEHTLSKGRERWQLDEVPGLRAGRDKSQGSTGLGRCPKGSAPSLQVPLDSTSAYSIHVGREGDVWLDSCMPQGSASWEGSVLATLVHTPLHRTPASGRWEGQHVGCRGTLASRQCPWGRQEPSGCFGSCWKTKQKILRLIFPKPNF